MIKHLNSIRIFILFGFYNYTSVFYLLLILFKPVQSRLYFINTFSLLYNTTNTCKWSFRFPFTIFYLKNFLVATPPNLSKVSITASYCFIIALILLN